MSSKKIFLISFFTYFFIATFTYHPDIKTIFYQVQFLKKGIFNIYSFLKTDSDFSSFGEFVYPPLAYFLMGLIFIPVKILAGEGFVEWLSMGNDFVSVRHIYRYLFSMKFFGISIFLLSGYFLSRLLKEEKKKKLFLVLFLLNPISLYVVAVMGQIDSIAASLTALALFFAFKNPFFSLVFLSLGAAFKTYPLILIPFFSFLSSDKWKKRIIYLILGMAIYFLFVVPFVFTPKFFSSTIFSGLSKRIFELRLPIGFGENILILPLFFTFLLISTLFKGFNSLKNLNFYFFTTTSLMSAGSYFHPQWLLWSLPFLSLAVASNLKNKSDVWFAIFLLFAGWLGKLFLFDDKFLTWGLFLPLDEGVLFLPPLSKVIEDIVDVFFLRSLVHSVILGAVLWLSLRILVYEKER